MKYWSAQVNKELYNKKLDNEFSIYVFVWSRKNKKNATMLLLKATTLKPSTKNIKKMFIVALKMLVEERKII